MSGIMDHEAPMLKETKKKAEHIYFKLPRLAEETVRAEMWYFKYFYDPIHNHEVCQITFILESDGVLFIGDRLTQFRSGEFSVIGKNTQLFHRSVNYI